jgi:hypothetical protein
MGYIDQKIREIIKEIVAEEFRTATRLVKIKESKPEVSIAT